jgi:hypothetical protein
VVERALVQLAAVAADHLADAQQRRLCVAEDPLERCAPLEQRAATKILRAVAQDIEGDERGAQTRSAVLAGEMDPSLQLLKAGGFALRVERDDLAVQDQRLLARRRPFLECRGDLWKLVRLLIAEPRPEADRGTGRRPSRGNGRATGLLTVR